ncbi:MAG: neutral/alkaline non-lysosomal ceramidase N-terminal domain-containing protein [Sandaracinaceae bacterium]
MELDLSAFAPRELGMFGWGAPAQRVEGVSTPLHARAMLLDDGTTRIALVCLELGLVTWPVRIGVLAGLARRPHLGLGPHHLMLSATHTHCGPAGLSPYLLFHTVHGGYVEELVRVVVDRTLDALERAHAALEPSELAYAEVVIPRSVPIAFNRSLAAYRRNPDVAPAVREEDATRRRAPTLIARDVEGRIRGLVQWFGVHATSLHADHRMLDGDLKGRASRRLEAELPDCVAIFAQEACGDVTPSPRWDAERKCRVGMGETDEESAELAAGYHVDAARRAIDEASPLADVSLGARVVHVAMDVAAEAPAVGLSVTAGTDEGPGPFAALAGLFATYAQARAWGGADPKPGLDLRGGAGGSFAGLVPRDLFLSVFRGVRGVDYAARLAAAGDLDDVPLAPTVLPVQRVRIGPVQVLGLPCEPTTVSGQRLRAALGGTVVVAGLSNAYGYYCTTPEEYAHQAYEGACTLYGARTLAAFRDAALGATPDASVGEAVGGPETPSLPIETLRRQRIESGDDGRAELLHPRDEPEVAALVRRARKERRIVRVVGSAHSEPGAIAEPSAMLLSLDRLDGIRVRGRVVEAGAGVRFGADPRDPLGAAHERVGLNATLARHGLALPSLGGISHQTVVGYLATGSAGGSFSRSVASCVRAFRLIDGRGELRVVERDQHPDLFSAVGCAMGLTGVVTSVELACIDAFDVAGEERHLPGAALSDPVSLLGAHTYARALWFPQPGVDRVALWTGDPMPPREPGDGANERAAGRYDPFPRVAGSPLPAQVGAAVALRLLERWPAAHGEAIKRGIYEVFSPPLDTPARRHRDVWHRALCMDDTVDDRVLPVRFLELWVGRDDAAEAVRRLRRHAERGWDATGTLAWEIYPGPESPFLLAPGHGRTSVRFNVFQRVGSRATPDALFEPVARALEDLDARPHWGKHVPASASHPNLVAFEAVRSELDPEGRFLTSYWRRHLHREVDAVIAPPRPRARPTQLPFRLAPADAELVRRARSCIDLRAEMDAPPDVVFDALVGLERARRWLPMFRRVAWLNGDGAGHGAVFDEVFSFLTLRIRTLEHERGRRWVATVLGTSLPLASEMVEQVDLEPLPRGRTRFRWRIAYTPLAAVAPAEPLVRPLFESFFGAAVEGLRRYVRTEHATAVASCRCSPQPLRASVGG